ncbi:diguanylate cyclase (GGDEF) domain-containing protein [Desulfuromonas thiophila]|uniref:diguanylate cyclase n=2 Tax=Desulfuromonas thiophila TaxID=57664 RepID=A0A1G6X131_9BACT|nr:diguanylate cyclase (GGDEF) domain-containing protein [Desulfuromonas thiophila]
MIAPALTPPEKIVAPQTCFHVWRLGMTGRTALVIALLVVLPQAFIAWLIETGSLPPGKNYFFTVPLLVAILILPLARCLAYFLVNRDLQVVNRFCQEIQQGNYGVRFDLPNEGEDEDAFIVLQRNLSRMSRDLSLRREATFQHFRAMAEEASTDPLTGLYNRRFLEQLYGRCGPGFCAEGAQISALCIDCDRFKQVNDSLGHHVGDRLLRDLAQCILGAIREGRDIPLRLGGDEFAVLLPHANLDQAEKIAHRIRQLYHQVKVPMTSLSIGIAATACQPGSCRERLDALIRAADAQAYQVKRRGGDGVARPAAEALD